MGNFIAFAEIMGAIIAAMGLAMCLEWLTLSGLLHLVPGQNRQPRNSLLDAGKSAQNHTASPEVRKGTDAPAIALFPR